MHARERTPIWLGIGLGLIICLFVGCSTLFNRGPEITGSLMTVLPSNIGVLSVPDTIDTVMIADSALHNGREFVLNIKSPEILFRAEGPGQRFGDASEEPIQHLWGCDSAGTSDVPLSVYPLAPCPQAILKGPGIYTLRLHIMATDSIWEIDGEESTAQVKSKVPNAREFAARTD